ncbi:MAG: tetratricopeptide repeat protein [Tepidisphaeraceae bacterium]|jgi:predicted O-linked N-acetylglucosamine transferase (SPINDLY family)
MHSTTLEQSLVEAMRHQQAGRLDEAENLYRRILARHPDSADALHLLGVLCAQRGRNQEGVELIRQAISRRPQVAGFHANLGHALLAAKSIEEAAKAYRDAARLNPKDAELQIQLGTSLKAIGRLDEAVACARQALTLNPKSAKAEYLLGAALQGQGELEGAVEAYRRAGALEPNSAPAQNHLGNIFRSMRRLDDAIACYRRALTIQLDDADAWSSLAIATLKNGEPAEAIDCAKKALAIRPDFAQAISVLADALREAGRFDEAIAEYQRVIALRPGSAENYNNLAVALRGRERLEEALAAVDKALALRPDLALLWSNRGGLLRNLNRAGEAIAALRRALQIDPDSFEGNFNLAKNLIDVGRIDQAMPLARRCVELNPQSSEARNTMANALKEMGQVDKAIEQFDRALELHPDDAVVRSNRLYTLYFDTRCSQADLLAEHCDWADHYAQPLKPSIRPHENDRDPDRRLRIGYVSPNFNLHPVGRFLSPLLAAHDHERFEIYCYASVGLFDGFTTRMQSYADVWRDIRALSNEEAAEVIRNDRIDILVDLTMHMAKNRMLLFARKPAPVQATYLAYAGTTGLDTIDYRITDPHLDPPGSSDEYYTERSIHLAETYWCYEPPIDLLEMAPLPAATKGFITFGCLNNFCKNTAEALQAWCRILAAVPNSRLLLHAATGSHRDAVRQRLSDSGIDPNRVSFMGKIPLPQFMQQHQIIDIGLDPFPYVGGTTTCDALWMGVPVVTLRGQTAISRGGASIMTNIGLPELIAESPEQYVRIAVELATDLPRLIHLRGNLREKMRTSPLMDAPRFARDMEAAYRQMWRNWCQGIQ